MVEKGIAHRSPQQGRTMRQTHQFQRHNSSGKYGQSRAILPVPLWTEVVEKHKVSHQKETVHPQEEGVQCVRALL
eukprot:4366620-Amphidinium_carterae.2